MNFGSENKKALGIWRFAARSFAFQSCFGYRSFSGVLEFGYLLFLAEYLANDKRVKFHIYMRSQQLAIASPYLARLELRAYRRVVSKLLVPGIRGIYTRTYCV
jgi:hypothetical protein